MQKFTDKFLKSLKPQPAAYTITEMDGFSIRVYPSGKKAFVYVFKEDGKIKKPIIAPYPDVSLKDARDKYQTMHSRRKQGLPLVEDGHTLKELADNYINDYAKRKKSSWKEDKRILDVDVLPSLGKKKAKEIRRGDVTKMLSKIAEKAPCSANNAFKILRRVYNWAIETDQYGLEFSPCDRLSQPQPDTKKKRFLTAEEIRAFWYGLEKTNISRSVICGLRLILVTAQRPTECCGLPMGEISGDWWELPEERTKNGNEHRVYLTDLAKEIIQPGVRRKYAFPSPSTKKPFSHKRLSQALLRFRSAKTADGDIAHWPFKAFTPHDLRRTCSTHLQELGFSDEIINALRNSTKQGVEGIYNRYKYDKEKKAALIAWEKRLREILAAGYDVEVKEKPSVTKKELTRLVWSMPIREVGKKLGVSDVAVHKMCKRFSVEKPPRGYWLRDKAKK